MKIDAAANFLAFANGTQNAAVLPDANASLKATVVDRLLFLDAAASLTQVESNPFGTWSDQLTTANRRTSGTYRLSPFVAHDFSPRDSVLLRQDAAVTTNGAGTGTRLTSNQTLFRFDRKPVPLGGSIEVSRLQNRSSGTGDANLLLEAVRLRGNVALDGQLVVGVAAGRERSHFLLSDQTDPLYGLTLAWNPGPRTELSASVEHHFFGLGGSLNFRHRMPFMSLALSLSRQPVTASTSLGVFADSSGIAAFLDAILTTRYPDPAVRATLVNNLISSRGLQSGLPGAIDVIADYPQLQTAANLSWVLLGTRNTASISLYGQTQRQLTQAGEIVPISPVNDNRQVGVALQFSRRLTPQTSLDAQLRWARITGLAVRAGDSTGQTSYRLAWIRNLSPRTGLSAGVQYNRFTTNVGGLQSYNAALAFVGMSHRF